jgi:hypothetical protein
MFSRAGAPSTLTEAAERLNPKPEDKEEDPDCSSDPYASGCEPDPCGSDPYCGGGDPYDPGPGGLSYADDGSRDGSGECPSCKKHDHDKHRAKYDDALKKIDKDKCPDLYAVAEGFASHFQVWTEVRGDEWRPKYLGDFLQYSTLPGEPKLPDTVAFWEEHLLNGKQFPLTVAHEAAHALDPVKYSDGPPGTPLSQNPAEIKARSCML